MSDNIINIQYSSGALAEATGYNKVLTTDTFPLALLDEDGGANTLTVEVPVAFAASANISYVGPAKNGIPEAVLTGHWAADTTTRTTRINGTMPAGKQIKSIAVMGSASQNDNFRLADYTIGATTLQHDARNFADAAPVVFTIESPSLPLDIDVVRGGIAGDGLLSGVTIELEAVASGPTLTGPASTTEQAATVAAGTLLDTVTIFSLISGTFSIEQTIDSATATTLNYVAESGVNDCTPSTPVSGVPLEATISAAGVTPYQIQQEADDEVNTPATFNITLNGEATHEVVQTMIAVANTTPGESIFGTDLIAVEDDMQAYVVKAANGMNVTWADDGTFTTDADQTETITVGYFSAATGQWSCLELTIKDTSIIASGGILRNILRSPLKDILRNPIK